MTFTAVGNNDNANTDRQYIKLPVSIVDDAINEWSKSIILQIDAAGNDDVTGTGESDKIIILDYDAAHFVKFTTLTSGNDTNEETIATSSPTFTIGLFDAAGSGTVTGKKLYFSLTTNAADADDNTVASPGSDFTALTDVEADWISIDKASNLTAQTATVTLDIIDDATDEENQNVTVTLGIKGADFNGGKAFSSTTSWL